MKVDGTPLVHVAHYIPVVGLRRCKTCRRWFVVVGASGYFVWDIELYTYEPDSEVGQYVLALMEKEGKKIPKHLREVR